MNAPEWRILVVEDQKANATLIEHLLGSMGHQVELAFDGEQGALLALRYDYDFVLMDVGLPVIDGLEATRRIRSGPAPFRDVPIIALTADDDPVMQKNCIAAGMNSFLSKPVQIGELIKTLDRVLNGPSRRRG